MFYIVICKLCCIVLCFIIMYFVLCCVGNKLYLILSYLILSYWRWSTRICDSFWSKSLKISIFWVNLGAFNPLTILKRPKMYCNISILMKHINITINLLINWANFTKEANNWKVILFTYFGKQRVNSACCTNLLQLQPHFSETRDSPG